MMNTRAYLFALVASVGAVSTASAETQDVDIRAFEYLDVVETADGSVWKGVIVEQTPNVQYKIAIAGGSVHVVMASDVTKITKTRNLEFGGARAAGTRPFGSHPAGGFGTDQGVGATYDRGGQGLPKPFAKTGPRLQPELAIVFPSGDLSMTHSTSFAPSVRAGYEALFGNFGLGGGGLTRFTYWQFAGETEDAHWTLETQLYGRASMHVARVAFYGGIALGVDTNYLWINNANMSKTTLGFGMNLQSGIEVAATPVLGLQFGFDYHPGTDKIVDGREESVSYYGLTFGANLRL